MRRGKGDEIPTKLDSMFDRVSSVKVQVFHFVIKNKSENEFSTHIRCKRRQGSGIQVGRSLEKLATFWL